MRDLENGCAQCHEDRYLASMDHGPHAGRYICRQCWEADTGTEVAEPDNCTHCGLQIERGSVRDGLDWRPSAAGLWYHGADRYRQADHHVPYRYCRTLEATPRDDR